MKRILLVSYHYPPANKARAIRMLFFTKFLLEKGFKVDVLTSFQKNIDPSLENILNTFNNRKNLRIYRTEKSRYSRIYYSGRKIIQSKEAIRQKTKKEIKNKIKKILPNPKYIWYFKGVKLGSKLINEKKYLAIISSAKPITSHIISFQLTNIKKIPLVLEYGDPWSLGQFKDNFFKKQLEQKLLLRANRVIFTTDETKKKYVKTFSKIKRNKFITVYSGFDRKLMKPIKYDESDRCTINYLGNIYEYRDRLEPLFRSIDIINKNFEKIKMNFIGNINVPINRKKAPESIDFKNPVNFIESLRKMKEADALLLLGNKGGLQVPMKTFWYIGSKKPILVILGDENDPLKKLLREYDKVIFSENNTSEIAKSLNELFNSQKRYKRNKDDSIFYKKFLWENQLKPLKSILDELAKN